MAVIADLADAVVTAINAGSYSQTFTAVRRNHVAYELSDMATLHVTVVPQTISAADAARGKRAFDYAIGVGVQIRLSRDSAGELLNTAIDPYLTLCEEIDDVLEAARTLSLADGTQCHWLSSEQSPLFVRQHLDEWNQFTAIVTHTYRALR